MMKVEEYSSSSTGQNEFPEDISQEILALLLVESLCRSRSVCKEWNILFSSSKFITNRWDEAPPNKNPWLFLCRDSDEGPMDSSTYCFFTRTWKNCSSFSFISRRSEYAKYKALYCGLAQGMFLVDVVNLKQICVINIYYNPKTQSYHDLNMYNAKWNLNNH